MSSKKQKIEGHQNCTICHPDLNRKWAKKDSKGFRERYSDRKRIFNYEEAVMNNFKDQLEKVDLDNISEEEAEKLKEDIAAFAELEMLCAADCNCEESCAIDIKRAMEEEDDKLNSEFEEYKKTPKGELEAWKKEKANNALKNGTSGWGSDKHKGFSPGGSVGLEDWEKKFKSRVKYHYSVKEKFRSILYKYGMGGFNLPEIVNSMESDRTKAKLVKPYCDNLVELYFWPAFESKILPKALVDEILNGGKFQLTYGVKSCDTYYDGHWKKGIGELENKTDPVVIILLNGLISNFSKESKLAMDTFTDEQVKEHEQDILAFAELETVCSSDCDCEESCAADIDFEVKINNDHRLKAFVQNSYLNYKELVNECEKNGVSQESLINTIAMLSTNRTLRKIFDRLCDCKYEINGLDKEIENNNFIVAKIFNILKQHSIEFDFLFAIDLITAEKAPLKTLSNTFFDKISDDTKFKDIPIMIKSIKKVIDNL